MEELDVFFNPKSIAVVGASPRVGSVGRAILENLISSYRGEIYPVNPKYDEILGLKSYPSISSIPEPPDLAVITVRADRVPPIAEDAGKAGVRGLIVVSGGFAESGPGGRELEERLVSIVRRYGMRLVGPNCIGVYDASTGVDTFFIPKTRMRRPPLGRIAVVSQSGAFLTTFMDYIATENVGIVRAINIGNKADVDEVDLIDYLAGKNDVDVIMLYLEDVSPGRGQDLIRAALDARANGKHIVALKGGRTESGTRAASSHTAALSGDYEVFKNALKQAGIIETDGPVEFLDAAKALAQPRRPKGRTVAVLTHAGGPGVISVDLLSKAGLEVPETPKPLRVELRSMFPERVAVGNPIDLTGDATEEDYRKALDAIMRHGFGDLIYIIAYIQPPTISGRVADVIVEAYNSTDKPFVVLTGGSIEGEEMGLRLYKDHNIPTYNIIERAVNAAKALYLDSIPPCYEKWEPVRIPYTCREKVKLSETEALEVAKKYGLKVPKYCLATDPQEAVECFKSIGSQKVVAKVVSPRVVHKSDIGGVITGITSPEEAERAYNDILENYLRHELPREDFTGILYQEQVKGIELIVGGRVDPFFGPVEIFGGGGVLVELIRDVSIRVAPLNRCEAERMIRETRAYSLIKGFRGMRADYTSILEALLAVSRMLTSGEVVEIDVNPLIANESGAYAADVRVYVCK